MMQMGCTDKKQENVSFGMILSLLSFLGMLIIFFSTKNFGVGVSPDSTHYLIQAQNILEGKPISTATWPPLYPAMIALLSGILNTSLLVSARILNTGLFGITVLASGLLYRRYLKSSIIIYSLAIVSVLVSTPLIPVYMMAWSEPPFIVFATLFLFFIDSYMRDKKLKFAIFSAICVGLCCLIRYIGISFILVGVICIVLAHKQRIMKLIIDLFSFIIISSAPIAFWLIRNRIVLGSFTGGRAPSAHSFAENIRSMGNSIMGWYLPGRVVMNRLLIAIIFLVLGFFVVIYFKEVYSKEKRTFSWQSPFIVFVVVYLILLVASSKLFHPLIDSRFLSPILVPLNLLLITYMKEILKIFRGRIAINNLNVLLIPILIVFIITPIWRTRATLKTQINDGKGYTSKIWRESELLKHYQDYTKHCDSYSNGSDVIRFYHGEEVEPLPRKTFGSIEVATIESLSEEWPNEKYTCLVVFNNINRDYNFTPEELIQISELTSEIEFNDGKIYFLTTEKNK